MSHCYIIAEAGVNHNANFELALQLVDQAAEAGADAVKFQTFNAEKLASSNAPKASYQYVNSSEDETQLEMLRKLELPYDWHWKLRDRAKKRGIEFLSTAFDHDSLDFLEELNLPFYKIPSGEITNGPLLWQFGHCRRPLVLSTGMANLSDVELALAVIVHSRSVDNEPRDLNEVWRAWGRPECRAKLEGSVILLHCTSQYPTPLEEVNLNAMDALKVFGLPIGYSDHTEGILIPIAAVARGATIIEKHFTLDRNLSGPDHKASLEPAELALMVRQIRSLEVALGHSIKCTQHSEWNTRDAARQKVVAACNIRSGSVFQRSDLTTRRSSEGLEAMTLWECIGKEAKRDYSAGDVIVK